MVCMLNVNDVECLVVCMLNVNDVECLVVCMLMILCYWYLC